MISKKGEIALQLERGGDGQAEQAQRKADHERRQTAGRVEAPEEDAEEADREDPPGHERNGDEVEDDDEPIDHSHSGVPLALPADEQPSPVARGLATPAVPPVCRETHEIGTFVVK